MRMHSGAQKPIKKPVKHRLERAEILGALIEADIYRYNNHSKIAFFPHNQSKIVLIY